MTDVSNRTPKADPGIDNDSRDFVPPPDELYRILPFEPRHGNCGGSLIQFQPGRTGNALPFRIAKVLYIFDIAPGDCRGRHAHYRTLEIVVCLQGGCTVRLDNGLGRQETVRIERPDRALLLPPRVWRELRDFEPGTRLLAIADTPYDESDYIRDYDRFLAIVRPKENPV